MWDVMTKGRCNRGTAFWPVYVRPGNTKPGICGGDVRLAVTRFGVVLAPHGGSIRATGPHGRLKTEAVIGNGWQPLSWIDREDLVRAMIFLTENGQLSGTFNFTAPERLTQKEFMREVARHYGALLLPVPGFAVKMFYGEASPVFASGAVCRAGPAHGGGIRVSYTRSGHVSAAARRRLVQSRI